MTTITEEKIGMVKDYAKVTEKTDGKVFLTMDEDLFTYCRLLELDYNTMIKFGDVHSSMCYEKLEDGTYKLTCKTLVNQEGKESCSGIFFMDFDVLGYFENAESVDEFMSGDADEVATKISEYFPDVYDAITNRAKDNLDKDYIDDDLKTEIADEWIQYNPNEAFDKAVENLGSSDLADCICGVIRNSI